MSEDCQGCRDLAPERLVSRLLLSRWPEGNPVISRASVSSAEGCRNLDVRYAPPAIAPTLILEPPPPLAIGGGFGCILDPKAGVDWPGWVLDEPELDITTVIGPVGVAF